MLLSVSVAPPVSTVPPSFSRLEDGVVTIQVELTGLKNLNSDERAIIGGSYELIITLQAEDGISAIRRLSPTMMVGSPSDCWPFKKGVVTFRATFPD